MRKGDVDKKARRDLADLLSEPDSWEGINAIDEVIKWYYDRIKGWADANTHPLGEGRFIFHIKPNPVNYHNNKFEVADTQDILCGYMQDAFESGVDPQYLEWAKVFTKGEIKNELSKRR